MSEPNTPRSRRPSTPLTPSTEKLDSMLSESLESLHQVQSAPSTSGRQMAYLDYAQLPHVSLGGLRAALLGYLGEVEGAVRERFGHPTATSIPGNEPGSSSFMLRPTTDSLTSSLRDRTSSIRRRLSESAPTYTSLPNTEFVLNHLAALREDVMAALPALPFPSLPNLPKPAILDSLPSRLAILDFHLGGLSGDTSAVGDEPQPPGVESARARVIRLVHTLLPSEEWAGWERLGWEEQDGDGDLPSDIYHDRERQDYFGAIANGEEEEPEYLFPNRTPRVVAQRRRQQRSKSLGSLKSYGDLGRGEAFEMPALDRSVSHGLPVSVFSPDGSPLPSPQVALHPKPTDTKLTKLTVPQERLPGPTVAESLKLSEQGKRLIHFQDLPVWWQNNEHIVTGYRFIPLHAKTGPIPLIRSAMAWHNETLNIHTHLIPTLLLLAVAIPLIIHHSPLPNAHILDTITLLSYLLAAVACLVSSAGWHILSGCAARKWFEWGACVDYIGISWLIAASFNTVVYNAFYCSPKPLVLYTVTNICCGAAGSILPFQAWFNRRENKNWRILFFLALCAAMIAPVFHLMYRHGYSQAKHFVSPFGLSGSVYILGLLFYAFHFPEAIWPGKFDYFGASHQLWHLAIVCAIYLHYRAIFIVHSTRFEYSCALPDSGLPITQLLSAWVYGPKEG